MLTYNIKTGCPELYIKCKHHSALIKPDETFHNADDVGILNELTKATAACFFYVNKLRKNFLCLTTLVTVRKMIVLLKICYQNFRKPVERQL